MHNTYPNSVDIIMPVYNNARYIGQAIASVQAQTYCHWRLLVQDDCSTDATAAIVQTLACADERIVYACNDSHCGAAMSRNHAMCRVKGKWIAFLDGDDCWHPDKLEHQLQYMIEHGYACSYTAYKRWDEGDRSQPKRVSGPECVTHRMQCRCNWLGCLTVMYDMDCIGPLYAPDLKRGNDYALWFDMTNQKPCHLLDETLATYHRHPSGSLHARGIGQKVYWHYRVLRSAARKTVVSAVFKTGAWIGWAIYKKWQYERII